MIALAILLLGAAALLVAHAEFAVLARVPGLALRVLMYHRVGATPDRTTVTPEQIVRQVRWLRAQGYTLVRLRDVIRHVADGAPLPDRPVLLTFDDGTADVHDVLLPLLRRLDVPAAAFVVPGLSGSTRDAQRRDRFATPAELRAMAEGGVEIGLHTFGHRDLSRCTPSEVVEDVARCMRWLGDNRIPFAPALAFPFGAYPRKDPARRSEFLAALTGAGVAVAFRIGNRVNPVPLAAPLELQRTEVRGDEPFWAFTRKVRRGRRKGFA